MGLLLFNLSNNQGPLALGDILGCYLSALGRNRDHYSTRELLAWINHVTRVFSIRRQFDGRRTRKAAPVLTLRNLRRALYSTSDDEELMGVRSREKVRGGKMLRFSHEDFLRILAWRARVLAQAEPSAQSEDALEQIRACLDASSAVPGVFPALPPEDGTDVGDADPGEEKEECLFLLDSMRKDLEFAAFQAQTDSRVASGESGMPSPGGSPVVPPATRYDSAGPSEDPPGQMVKTFQRRSRYYETGENPPVPETNTPPREIPVAEGVTLTMSADLPDECIKEIRRIISQYRKTP